MSKKRSRSRKVKNTEASSGIPSEEVLADGSGPVEALGASAGEVGLGGEDLGHPVHLTPLTDSDLEATSVDGESDDAVSVLETGELADNAVIAADEVDHEHAAELTAVGDHGEAAIAAGAELEGAELEGVEGAELEGVEGAELEGVEGEAAVMPLTAATMDAAQLKQLVEALVFASDKPLTVQRLRQLTRVSDVRRLEQALTELAADYEHRGLILHQVSGGYQFRTRPQFSVWVQQLIAGRPVRLSRAQLETLAIVAYRQPITRPEIDDIRGVDSSATLKLLMDRLLIRVLGKKEEVGRPMLYGTTKEFLDFFSLGDLRELPTLREYSELSDESRKVMSARLGVPLDETPGGGNDPDDSGGESGGSDGGNDPGMGGGDMGGGDMGGGGDAEPASADASALAELADAVLASNDHQAVAIDDAIDAEAEVVADDVLHMDATGALHAEAGELPVDADGELRADAEADGELRADAEASDADVDVYRAETVDADEDLVHRAETVAADEDALLAGELAAATEAEAAAEAAVYAAASDDEQETNEIDPVTDAVALAEAPDLEASQTSQVDPLIAAEALAYAETLANEHATTESSE